MKDEEIKGGATEFLLNFDALLKANEEEELKSVSLRSVRNALKAEIDDLHKKKEILETQIKENIVQCDKEISTRKENAERNFEAERIRLANLSKQLEAQKTEQADIEIKQRQRTSELNEKERLLNEREIGLNHKEVDLNAKIEQIKKDIQIIASEKMEIKKQLQFINEQLGGIEQAKQGIQDNTIDLKKEQFVLREAEENLVNKIKEIKETELKNIADRKEIEAIGIQLEKDQKQVTASLNILTKQKKDNEDKEAALKAMKIDLDFRIAQLKREHEKDNK